jgi:hypothetical protein
MMIVIVYAGHGEGKTTHAKSLQKKFKCKRIVDEWMPGSPNRDGDLLLTTAAPPFDIPGAWVTSLAEALR